MGYLSQALADETIVMGNSSNVSGKGSISLGAGNNVQSSNVVALGNNQNIASGLDNAVVLGNASCTKGSSSTVSNTTSATVGNYTFSGFKGTVAGAGNFVSIGAVGNERKLTNLAAGDISATSTEAINGSQLYAVANVLGTAIDSTATVASTAASAANSAASLASSAYSMASNAASSATAAISTAESAASTSVSAASRAVAAASQATSSASAASNSASASV